MEVNAFIHQACRIKDYKRPALTDYIKWKKVFEQQTHTVDSWAEWSLCEDQPYDEVIFRAIYAETHSGSNLYICYTYLIGNTVMPANMIEDLCYITSGFFSWDSFTDENVRFICDILAKGKTYDAVQELANRSRNDDVFGRQCRDKVSHYKEIKKDELRVTCKLFFESVNKYQIDIPMWIKELKTPYLYERMKNIEKYQFKKKKERHE